MSFNSRDQLQKSEAIQDAMPVVSTFDSEGDNLSAIESGSNETLGKLVRWVMGFSRLLGENSRRKGFQKFHGADISLTGTITSSGTTVTGSGTAFLTQLSAGDFIAGTANEYREVLSISSDTSLTLVSAFTVDIGSGQAYKRIQTLAERLDNQEVGVIIQGVQSSPPAGFLLCDGSAVSRVAYARLFAVSPSTTSTVTITNTTPAQVTWMSHGLKTGHSVQFSTTGSLPSPLVAGTVYFIRRVDSNVFHLYDTLANAMNTGSTTGRINTTTTGSGTHTGLCYYFGNGNGSTTFNLPDLRGAVPRGAGTSAGYIQSASVVLGEKVDDAMQGHRHIVNNVAQQAGAANWNFGSDILAYQNPTTTDPVTDGTNGTPRTANETRGKAIGLNFFIRF